MTTDYDRIMEATRAYMQTRSGPLARPTGTKKKPPRLPERRVPLGRMTPEERFGGLTAEKTPLVKPALRGLQLVGRPFEAAGEALATVNEIFGVKGAPKNIAAQERTRQLGARLTSGEISPRDAIGELIANQEQRPLAERLFYQTLAAPSGGVTSAMAGVRGLKTAAKGVEAGGRAASQAAQKAAPVARRLAMEEVGAVGKVPKKPSTIPVASVAKKLTKAQEADKLDEVLRGFEAETEAKTLGVVAKPALETKTQFVARRIKEFKEEVAPFRVDVVGTRKQFGAEYDAAAKPITSPVASEALSPAAKAAKATEGVAGAAREPWQMTRAEFYHARGFPHTPTLEGEASHWNIARRALAEGKPVPANVLADYPDLARMSSKAPVGARRTPQQVSEVGQIAKESKVAPTGVKAAADQGRSLPGSAVPPAKPPIKPPVTTGGMGEPPRPTPEEATAALGRLTQFIHSPESVNLSDLTVQVRQKQLGERLGHFQDRTEALLGQGMPFEGAMKQAQGETMSGAFDRPLASLSEVMADQFRDSAFARVYEVLKNEPLERMSTVEALTNALLGKGIPRTPGTAGGSAYTRLSRVFPPEVMAILEKDKALVSKFEDVLLQSGEKYKFTTPQGPWPPTFEMKGEQPGMGIFGKAVEIQGQRPAPLTQGEMFDLQTFGMERPQGVSRPLYEPSIEAAIKMPSMWPTSGQNWFVRAAKELGMTALDIANFMRSNKTGFDFSWWRQQVWLTPNHIRSFYKANIVAWKAMWSKKFAEAFDKSWKSETFYYQHYQQTGYDFMRPLEQKGVPVWQREERYAVLGSERPISKFSEKVPWIRLPQRAFVSGTNAQNWDIFKGYVDDVYKLNEKIASGAIKMKPGEAFDIGKSIELHAAMLADMTGRAKLGPLKEMTGAINAGFFSMRLNLGRLLMPRHLVSADPLVRKEAWKNILKTVGTIGAVELLGQKMGLWEVEVDPRSPDVGQMRIGPVRFDPWGGMKKFVVLLARLATMETKSGKTGQVYPTNLYMTVGRFVAGMESPGASMLSEFITGETFAGDEVDWTSAKQWADRVAPMSLTDMWEAMDESNSVPLGVMSGVVSAVGVGVTAYGQLEAMWKKELKLYLDIRAKDDTIAAREAAAKARAALRAGSPEIDAKLFIIGQVTSLGSLDTIQQAARLIQQYGINPDDIKGIAQRKERQEQARLAGKALEWTEVDMLMFMLERAATPAPRAQPTPSARGTPTPSAITTSSGWEALRELEPVR